MMEKEVKKSITNWLKRRFEERNLPNPIEITFNEERINIGFAYNVSMLLKKGMDKDLNLLELYIDECEENLKNVKTLLK